VTAETPSVTFKAKPLNPHLFEHASKLPVVERKSATGFQEFSLSSSNTYLGKRTYNEYVKAQTETKQFKARPFDRALTQRKSICEERPSVAARTQFVPFNL
jgi:hypothetical protein